MNSRRKIVLLLAIIFLALYVGTYAVLSRRGYAEADQWKFKGFYYFTPAPTDHWRSTNYGCAFAYWPINQVDQWLGLGRAPASEPLWGLSNIDKE